MARGKPWFRPGRKKGRKRKEEGRRGRGEERRRGGGEEGRRGRGGEEEERMR